MTDEDISENLKSLRLTTYESTPIYS
jgi:hypothetical protein